MAKYTMFKDGLTFKTDPNTGELNEASVAVKVDTSSFIMLFLNSISCYVQLTGNQMRLLAIIWATSSYNPNGQLEGNLFTNSPLFKKQVREYGLDWTDSQINNEVSRLAKTELIKKVARGSYILNPLYFFKGTLADRTKLMMTIKNTGL